MVEMTYGMEEMLGLGPDLSAVLVAFALKTSVDLTTSVSSTSSPLDLEIKQKLTKIENNVLIIYIFPQKQVKDVDRSN